MHDLFYIRIDSRQEMQWFNGTVYYIGCCLLKTLEGDTLERRRQGDAISIVTILSASLQDKQYILA